MTWLLAVCAAGLAGVGTWLAMDRTLTRILLGIGLWGHAAVLLLLVAGGPAGEPPIAADVDPVSTSAKASSQDTARQVSPSRTIGWRAPTCSMPGAMRWRTVWRSSPMRIRT